jgi:thiol-disulfide isomerase/thioredoxin
VDDGRRPGDPGSPESGYEPLRSGLPVGRTGTAVPAAASAARAPSRVMPMIVLALAAGLGLGLAIGLLLGKGGGEAAPTTAAPTTTGAATTVPWVPADAYGAPVTVSGAALPMLSDAAPDAAVGMALPEITGTDYDGNPRSITANGKPKLIVALAHWCPYCNAEIPILLDWYPTGVPEGIELISLSVYPNPTRQHFPPKAWMEEADWTLPLIADDDESTVVATLGIPAVPFWLLVSADGLVMERGTGQVEASVLDGIIDALEATTGGTTTVP